MSSSNQVRVSYYRESTYDAPPATDQNLQIARMIDEDLSYTPNAEADAEIRTDRMVPESRHLSATTGGPVRFNFSAKTSGLVKGESLVDTALNLQAMSPDIIVIRHPHPGVPHALAQRISGRRDAHGASWRYRPCHSA